MRKEDLNAIIRWRRRLADNEVAHDLLIAEAGCRSVIAGRKAADHDATLQSASGTTGTPLPPPAYPAL